MCSRHTGHSAPRRRRESFWIQMNVSLTVEGRGNDVIRAVLISADTQSTQSNGQSGSVVTVLGFTLYEIISYMKWT